MSKVIVIAGAGPGNGAALARRFGAEGYAVGLLSRSAEFLKAQQQTLGAEGIKALGLGVDITDSSQVKQAIAQIERDLGKVTVLIQNASLMYRGPFLEMAEENFRNVFNVSIMGMVHCCQAVLPTMVEQGVGSIIVIGATGSLRGSSGFAPFAVGKFGQRALAQSLAREYSPKGIHVAHVIIDGPISNPRTLGRLPGKSRAEFLEADHIAEAVWHIAGQRPSAWTHELDLRPFGENF